MPVYLFNDLFAYTTIDVSEKIFVLMEEKAMIWRSVGEMMLSLTKKKVLCFFLDFVFSIGEKCFAANV